MKVIRRKCQNGYRHFFVREDVTWDDPHPKDGSQMRELLLVCARCSYHLWIDSTVRTYTQLPWVWRGT